MWLRWGVDKLGGIAACRFCCLFLCISMVMDWVRKLHSDWSIDLLNRALLPREDVLLSVSLTHVKSAPVSLFFTLCWCVYVQILLFIFCFAFFQHPSRSSSFFKWAVYVKQHNFHVAVYFMPCAFMWSSVLCVTICVSINWVKWPPWVNTSAGCVYSRYNALFKSCTHHECVLVCTV